MSLCCGGLISVGHFFYRGGGVCWKMGLFYSKNTTLFNDSKTKMFAVVWWLYSMRWNFFKVVDFTAHWLAWLLLYVALEALVVSWWPIMLATKPGLKNICGSGPCRPSFLALRSIFLVVGVLVPLILACKVLKSI